MLDINLGNKTLAAGILIALILSYGMVSFDSDSKSPIAVTSAGTASQVSDVPATPAPAQMMPASEAVAAVTPDEGLVAHKDLLDGIDSAALPAVQRNAASELAEPQQSAGSRKRSAMWERKFGPDTP